MSAVHATDFKGYDQMLTRMGKPAGLAEKDLKSTGLMSGESQPRMSLPLAQSPAQRLRRGLQLSWTFHG